MKQTLLLAIPMLMNLWITPPDALAWGELGHKLVVEYGNGLIGPSVLANCHVTPNRLVEHTNDPDKLWRQERFAHPNEAEMHFFHVDKQPGDWRERNEAKDKTQGRLVYRIVGWIGEAKKLRQNGKWDALAEHLYGISHYLGDLSQPLHLHHDYDGVEAGVPGVHSQFETKMVNKYEDEIRAGLKQRLANEKIPAHWASLDTRNLIFDTAQQSHLKTDRLLGAVKDAVTIPRRSRRRSDRAKPVKPRFVKKLLWEKTGSLAMDQLGLSARLWAHVFSEICR